MKSEEIKMKNKEDMRMKDTMSRKSTNSKMMYTALFSLLLLLLGGCEKAPIDSRIEGMWRLEEYTTLEDGAVHPCEDIFYSIQLWVVDIACKPGRGGYKSSIGRFIYEEGDAVTMKDFHYRKGTTDDSKTPTRIEDLRPYGINSLETTFEVVHSDKHALTLRSDYATLKFSKF